jgi:hypothetical protein
MAPRIRYLILVPFVSALLMMAAIVEAPAGDAPVLVKGKFQTPVDLDSVVADWRARGYSDWASSWKETGWSSDHPYSQNCIRTVLEGRVEYIIDGQRFVVEPGDELFYPANATQTARNLHDGYSKMLVATGP